MSEFLARLRDRTEAAQPVVIRQYHNLVRVYRVLHDHQKDIDAAFDNIAKQVGYLATTTMPVRLEVGDQGSIKKIALDSDALLGTIFEKEFSSLLQGFAKKPLGSVDSGTYRFYLIWRDALKLKLELNWAAFVSLQPTIVFPPIPNEYTQWFEPGIAIAIEDAVAILAINETYPDLRLVERISSNRLAIAQMRLSHHPSEKPAFLEQRFGGRERDILTEVRALLANQQG
jgi:hypothetical protein